MKVLRGLPQREIDAFGSSGFRQSRVAKGDVQVSLVELDGVIGGHTATSRQLLAVVRGRLVVRGDDEEAELRARDAVVWEAGEWHESRSLEPSALVIVEGEFA